MTRFFATQQPSGKVRAERAVKLKPLFVVLSARGFHQWWLRRSLASFGEQSCGCQGGKKACCTLYTSCADSGRHLVENIKWYYLLYLCCCVLALLNPQWLANWLEKEKQTRGRKGNGSFRVLGQSIQAATDTSDWRGTNEIIILGKLKKTQFTILSVSDYDKNMAQCCLASF